MSLKLFEPDKPEVTMLWQALDKHQKAFFWLLAIHIDLT